MPESQGQLSSSQIRGWGYVCGLPAGTRCGVSSSSLPGSPPPHGSRRVTRAHSLVLRPRGLARGRPDPYRLPDVQGDDATRQGGTRRAVGRGLGATHWGHSSRGQWTPVELCANVGKGGCFPPPCGARSLPLSTSENQRGSGWLLLQAANAFRHPRKQTLHLPG